jgi:hypothetical protein
MKQSGEVMLYKDILRGLRKSLKAVPGNLSSKPCFQGFYLTSPPLSLEREARNRGNKTE